MPNPKRKHTRSRRDSRRASNWKLEPLAMSVCSNPQCGKLHRPHTVCPECGWYNGRLVVPPKQKKAKPGEGPQGEEKK
ncbi:MAG: 50S ribosomal protein L32 [Elusimicrobia bacterium]|nr:50S ribosomal protein L32 [Elusimicrobiota bacterium]